MLAATAVTFLVSPFVVFAALLVFRALTAPPGTGRHHIARVETPYRPRPAAPRTPVVPGPTDPAATAVTPVRDMAVPVPAVRRQAPLSSDISRLMDTLVADVESGALDARLPVDEAWNEAHREDWARQRVADEGFAWQTHMAKFDGTVLARPFLAEETREVTRIP